MLPSGPAALPCPLGDAPPPGLCQRFCPLAGSEGAAAVPSRHAALKYGPAFGLRKEMGRSHGGGKEKRGWGYRRRCHRPPRRRRPNGSHCSDRPEEEQAQSPVNPVPSCSGNPSSSSSTQNSAVPELPGFYYDPEKNRYFRLLSGHNNYNPLTKESIQYKAMESKRLRLLEEEEQQKRKTTRAGLNSSMLLQKRQLGLLSSTSYCRLANKRSFHSGSQPALK